MRRGTLIIRRFCVLLDAERVYRELSTVLEGEDNLEFASVMVQALNFILVTSTELFELRLLLKQSLVNAAGKDLFVSLYSSWCHSSVAALSLCLLAQAYQHANSIVHSLVEEEKNVKFFIQLDKLIHLLETPVFAYLRLQLLDPGNSIWLLKSLYGLLMLLPQQSAAFKILRTRLKTVPSFGGEQRKRMVSGNPFSQVLQYTQIGTRSVEHDNKNQDAGNVYNGINFASMLQQFEQMQHRHRMHSRPQRQFDNSLSSFSQGA